VETYDSESDYPFSIGDQKSERTIIWELKTNVPKNTPERQCLPVRLGSLYLSNDSKTLNGLIAVANLAFEKLVAVRFTFDYWKTTSEVKAEYSRVKPQKETSDGCDRFQFSIKLSDQANLQNKTLYLCIRYNVGGREYWDNNGGSNHQVDFVRKTVSKPWPKPVAPPGLPRSRHSSNNVLPRPRSYPTGYHEDEFSTSFESPFRLIQHNDRQAKPRSPPGSQADASQNQSNGRLANRYDFNASLHAALATAQKALGTQSGLRIKMPESEEADSKPKAIQATENKERPDLNSAEYKDLIQKFCYFGSASNSTDASLTVSPQPHDVPIKVSEDLNQLDGVGDNSSESNASSAGTSASNSPPSPTAQLALSQFIEHQQSAKDTNSSSSRSSSRSPTQTIRALSPRLLPYRAPSPAMNSAYQEFPHQGLSVQTTIG